MKRVALLVLALSVAELGLAQPSTAPAAATRTRASAPAESPLEIARKTAEQGESVESAGRVQDLDLEAMNQAAAALDAYRKLHPDDTKALLLSVRLGRLQEIGVQTFSAPLPEIGRKREAEESQRGQLRALQSLVDRVVALEPGNAEAHYLKARLFGFSNRTVYGQGPEPGIWDVEQAIVSARKAVELAPDVVAYREALASYLVIGQKFSDAEATLARVAGGGHSMSVLLREIAQVPAPAGAIALPGAAREFAATEAAKGRLSDYPDLRVRSWVVAGPAHQIEAFYRGRWPGFRFAKSAGEEDGDVAIAYFMELLRWEGPRLVAFGGGGKVENVSPADLASAVAVIVVEFRNLPAGEQNAYGALLPENDRKLYCVLTIVNYRAIK
jgi:hypothetical protein